MKIITILMFFIVQNAFAQTIKLPPRPSERENNKTLPGIDINNNGVRDDLEHFIFEKITKDPELFNAYIRYAESLSNVILLYPNTEKVRNNEKLIQSDSTCINIVDPNVHHRSQSSTRILRQIYNNSERNKIDKWYAKNSSKISEDYAGPESLDKKKVCRFK